MKSVRAEQLQANLDRYLQEAQREAIVITREGKPCAVLHGVPEDLEVAELAHSKEFWTMIEERRREDAIPWEEARAKLR